MTLSAQYQKCNKEIEAAWEEERRQGKIACDASYKEEKLEQEWMKKNCVDCRLGTRKEHCKHIFNGHNYTHLKVMVARKEMSAGNDDCEFWEG